MKTPKRVLRTSAILVVLILLAVFGYTAAGPYLAINGIRNAVASEQYGELWRFVDYARLRESVSPQLQERVAQGIIGRIGPSQTGMTIGKVTALIAKPTIDAMVSPQGIAILLSGTSLAQHLADDIGMKSGRHRNDPLATAKKQFESASLFTATVPNAEGQPVVFEFRRTGLSWKLTGLRLPDE